MWSGQGQGSVCAQEGQGQELASRAAGGRRRTVNQSQAPGLAMLAAPGAVPAIIQQLLLDNAPGTGAGRHMRLCGLGAQRKTPHPSLRCSEIHLERASSLLL